MAKRNRIWLKRGRITRKLVLVDGPVPRVGDICTCKGEDWTCTKVEQTEIIAQFSTAQGRLKQVFP